MLPVPSARQAPVERLLGSHQVAGRALVAPEQALDRGLSGRWNRQHIAQVLDFCLARARELGMAV